MLFRWKYFSIHFTASCRRFMGVKIIRRSAQSDYVVRLISLKKINIMRSSGDRQIYKPIIVAPVVQQFFQIQLQICCHAVHLYHVFIDWCFWEFAFEEVTNSSGCRCRCLTLHDPPLNEQPHHYHVAFVFVELLEPMSLAFAVALIELSLISLIEPIFQVVASVGGVYEGECHLPVVQDHGESILTGKFTHMHHELVLSSPRVQSDRQIRPKLLSLN